MNQTLQRILLVEDDADIQAVGQLALEAVGGFEVRVCSSGQEALAAAPQFAPDLILLDVMMPGMDGLTTYAALRRIPAMCDTPIVFMTAKVQPTEMARYREAGALGVISKPFDPMALAEQVHALWNVRALDAVPMGG